MSGVRTKYSYLLCLTVVQLYIYKLKLLLELETILKFYICTHVITKTVYDLSSFVVFNSFKNFTKFYLKKNYFQSKFNLQFQYLFPKNIPPNFINFSRIKWLMMLKIVFPIRISFYQVFTDILLIYIYMLQFY